MLVVFLQYFQFIFADIFNGNKDNVTDVEFATVTARYVKITVNDGGADSTARIADVEIYGKP